MKGDDNYFGRRANDERVAAMSASHPQARQAHLELAERYDELAKTIGSQSELSPDVVGVS